MHAGERVVYMDAMDSCLKWIAYVQRVFTDGLWLYVEGAPLNADCTPWDAHKHHCLVCTETDPATELSHRSLDQRQHILWNGEEQEKRILSLERHLQCVAIHLNMRGAPDMGNPDMRNPDTGMPSLLLRTILQLRCSETTSL